MQNKDLLTVLTLGLLITSCSNSSAGDINSFSTSIISISSSSIISSSTSIIDSTISNFDFLTFRASIVKKYQTKDAMDYYFNSEYLNKTYPITNLIETNQVIFIPPQPELGFDLPYILKFPSGQYKDANKENNKYLVLTDFGSSDSVEFDNPIRQYIEMNIKIGSGEINYLNSNWAQEIDKLDLITFSPLIARQCPSTEYDNAFNQHLDRDSVLATFQNRTNYMMKYCGDSNVPLDLPISEKDFVAVVDVEKQVFNQYQHALKLLKDANYEIQDKLIMLGYSTTGSFVSNFATIYPEVVKIFYSGGVSIPILPGTEYKKEKLLYPLGVSEHKELFGKEFDLEAYNKIAKIHELGKFERRFDAVDREIWPIVNRLFTGNLELWGDHSGVEREATWNKQADAFYELGGKGMYLFNKQTAHFVSKNDLSFIIEFIKSNLNSDEPIYPEISPFPEHVIRLG